MKEYEKVRQWMINRFTKELRIKPAELDPDRSLMDYGLGSIQLVEISGELEEFLDQTIDPSLFLKHSSINALAGFLSGSNNVSSSKKIQSKKQIVQSLKKNKRWTNFKHFPEVIALNKLKKKVDKISGMEIYLCANEGVASSSTVMEGRQYINFASYNYLGMSGDDDVTKAVIAAVKKYGSSVSGSRLIGGEKPLHAELEKEISGLIGTESCVVFNSGHATNVTTIGCIMKKNDLILLDKLNHNSITQGAHLSEATVKFFQHNDPQSLENILREARHRFERVLIVTEGIFSMDGDIPPIREYLKLKKQYHALLYIDEAHSLGVLGDTGGGLREYLNLDANDVDFWMGTLSKALGACGGYIAGKKILIDYLKLSAPGFVYSCGITPADTAAALSAIRKIKSDPARVKTLHERAHYFYTLLKQKNIPIGNCVDQVPVIPIYVGNSLKTIQLHTVLKKQGLYLPAIFYPAVEEGASRLRAFVNATHVESQLKLAAEIIAKEMKKLKLLR